jgi:hypothetical protein
MLQKIKSAVENSQPKKNSCGKCGSESLWLPRRSSQWQCWECDPPHSDAIVSTSVGGRKLAPAVRDEDPPLAGSLVATEPIKKPWLICSYKQVCSCGSYTYEELCLVSRIFRVCCKCGCDLEIEPFWS